MIQRLEAKETSYNLTANNPAAGNPLDQISATRRGFVKGLVGVAAGGLLLPSYLRPRGLSAANEAVNAVGEGVLPVDSEFGQLDFKEKKEAVKDYISVFQTVDKATLRELCEPILYLSKSGAPVDNELAYVETSVFPFADSVHFLAALDDVSHTYPMLGPAIHYPTDNEILKKFGQNVPDGYFNYYYEMQAMYLGRTEHPFFYQDANGKRITSLADIGYFGMYFGDTEDAGVKQRRPVVPMFLGWRTSSEDSTLYGGVVVLPFKTGQSKDDYQPTGKPSPIMLAQLDENMGNGLALIQDGTPDPEDPDFYKRLLLKGYPTQAIFNHDGVVIFNKNARGLYERTFDRAMTFAKDEIDSQTGEKINYVTKHWAGEWNTIEIDQALALARPADHDVPATFPLYGDLLKHDDATYGEITAERILELPFGHLISLTQSKKRLPGIPEPKDIRKAIAA